MHAEIGNHGVCRMLAFRTGEIVLPKLSMAASFRLYNHSFERIAKNRGRGYRAAARPRTLGTVLMTLSWFYWALLAAGFAALTAIFAKVGLEGVDSDLATLIRTFVIMLTLGSFGYVSVKWTNAFTAPKTEAPQVVAVGTSHE